jgi:hypothetical protein
MAGPSQIVIAAQIILVPIPIWEASGRKRHGRSRAVKNQRESAQISGGKP